mmetsp:Transcript_38156/g.88809  ORF Transcript_38156/g.88809 Transcript_38156/m.88809 type:complete len:342 (+) Transcript_38156:1921-2946(+)
MRLLRNGSEGHCPGHEPLDDIFHGLHFLQGHRALGIQFELELSAQGSFLVLCVGGGSKGAVGLPGISAGSQLEVHHALGGVEMCLASVAVVELSKILDQRDGFLVGRRVARLVEPFGITVDSFEVSTLDAGGGSGEAAINDFISKADSFKDLCPLVTLKRTNSHFAHNLEKALTGRLAVVVEKGFIIKFHFGFGLDNAIRIHLGKYFIGHIWTTSIASETKEGREIVYFLGVSRLGKDGRLGPLLGLQKMLMHGSSCQKGGQGHSVRTRHSIGEDHNLHSVPSIIIPLDGFRGFVTNSIQGRDHATRSSPHWKCTVDDLGGEGFGSVAGHVGLVFYGLHLL